MSCNNNDTVKTDGRYNSGGNSPGTTLTCSADNVSVKWSVNSDAASYNIYRSTDVNTDFYS